MQLLKFFVNKAKVKVKNKKSKTKKVNKKIKKKNKKNKEKEAIIKILGVDPGYAITGYSIIEYVNGKFYLKKAGAIITDKDTYFPDRLAEIYKDIDKIIKEEKPEIMSIEELFFNTNTTTAIKVAQARGVILTAARLNGIKIAEYTPLQVKQAVCGYGRASKEQVQYMVKTILKVNALPKLDDVTDSMAIAICHGHSGFINNKLKKYGLDIDK